MERHKQKQRGNDHRQLPNTNDSRNQNLEQFLNLSSTENVSELIDEINEVARAQGRDISSSQLRNIFAKVLAAKTVYDIQMLRPKLIYVAARSTSKSGKELIEKFERLAKEVKNIEQVKSFKIFMEAFVAYHKFHH